MKNPKPSIGADLLIVFAFVFGMTAGVKANNPHLVANHSVDHQALVATFKPYTESVAWIRELLKEDQESFRAQTLEPLSVLDRTWLAQATYQSTVPESWCGFWNNLSGNFVDLFPHNIYNRQLHRVLAVAHSQDLLLIAYKTPLDTSVVAMSRESSVNGIRCILYTLTKEKFSNPEMRFLTQPNHTRTLASPANFYGAYVNKGSFWQGPQRQAFIHQDKLVALQRNWIIKANNEVFINNRRAYRLYAWEEKTGTPAYFLLKKPSLTEDRWVLMLELESPNSANQTLTSLGAKDVQPNKKGFNYYWLAPIMGIGLFLYNRYGHRLRVVKKEQSRTQLALSALRAQLNPHFLFNSMSSIQDLVNEDNKPAANRYFNEMAQLLRYVVDSSNYAYMPLKQELAALEQYCSLEALRTPFQYIVEPSPDLDLENTEIPTMLLQPFVENAILHGLRPGTDPKELKIQLWPESDNCVGISILDNGIGIDEARRRGQKLQDTREHQGLANTQKRIELLNERKRKKITLQVIDRSLLKPNQSGTLVQLSIPL